jgi:hypothetical protein
VPDWDNTESRESDEDAAWRDLVARLEEPAATTGPAPWPDREDVPRPRPQPPRDADVTGGTPDGPEQQGSEGSLGADVPNGPEVVRGTPELVRGTEETREDEEPQGEGGTDGIRGFDDEGARGAFGGNSQSGGFEPGAFEPDVIQGARPERRAAHGTRARRIRARKAPAVPEDDDEHFVPPAPPPLPKLDPMAKGAWAALFGGPGYLVVATVAGWSVPGIAAFCAVAAFVTGFAILVLRMNEPGPGGPDDGDDGAVV